MDAECGNMKYPLIESIPELNSSRKCPYSCVLEFDSTVLLHLLLKISVILLSFIETLLICLKYIFEMQHTPVSPPYQQNAHLVESTW